MIENMISVILPVYNGSTYLRSSIESVLNQKGIEFELVVVNDASTDESSVIIESFAQRPEIKWFTNRENLGLFASLNVAVKLCSSPLIKVWAQDDVMKPGCLKSFKKVMTEKPDAGFYWCQSEVIDENWKWDKKVIDQSSFADGKSFEVSSENWTIEKSVGHFFWCGNLHGNISLMAFHRSDFERIGGFDESLIYSGDIDFTARILSTKTPVCILSDLVWLRNHTGQLSRSSRHLHYELVETLSVFESLKNCHAELLDNTALGEFCKRSYNQRSLPYFVSNALLVLRELKIKQGLVMLWILSPGMGVAHSLWYWLSQRLFRNNGPRLQELSEI